MGISVEMIIRHTLASCTGEHTRIAVVADDDPRRGLKRTRSAGINDRLKVRPAARNQNGEFQFVYFSHERAMFLITRSESAPSGTAST